MQNWNFNSVHFKSILKFLNIFLSFSSYFFLGFFCTAIAILINMNYLAFYPERKTISWFPGGKNAVDSMLDDRDYVDSTLRNYIKSIDELQNYVSIFQISVLY